MRQSGFQGFLIGELFMQEARPEEACLRFIQQLKKLRQHA
jgi:indole-3-glycerol phosphate synthase